MKDIKSQTEILVNRSTTPQFDAYLKAYNCCMDYTLPKLSSDISINQFMDGLVYLFIPEVCFSVYYSHISFIDILFPQTHGKWFS